MVASRDKQARIRLYAGVNELKQFSIQDLQQKCNVSRSVTQRFVQQLVSNGSLLVLHHRENGKAGGNIYALANAPIVLMQDRSKVLVGRKKIWTTIRILRQFQMHELEMCACVSNCNVKKYVLRLLKAEYLQVDHRRQNGSRDSNVYRLVRDTGPLAPVCKRNGTVFDPNTRKFYEIVL